MPSTFSSILVTGSRGMLAHAVLSELMARGHAFHACDIDTVNITCQDAVDQLFAELRPTLLINCAAYTNVDKCELEPETADAVNGHAVAKLAEAAKRHGTKVVHISTDFVFDGAKATPYQPNDTPGPLSAYGRSKLLGEQRLQQVDPPGWLIVRTAWLYGPAGNCFPQTILNAARAGKPLKVVADQTGTPTFTHDLAAILLDLVARDASGIYHGTNTGQTTWHDFTRAILDTFAVPADLSKTTAAEWKQLRPQSAVRPAYSVLDVSATEQVIGRPIPAWRDGLVRYRDAVEPASPLPRAAADMTR